MEPVIVPEGAKVGECITFFGYVIEFKDMKMAQKVTT